jgi:hypothetical protein
VITSLVAVNKYFHGGSGAKHIMIAQEEILFVVLALQKRRKRRNTRERLQPIVNAGIFYTLQ